MVIYYVLFFMGQEFGSSWVEKLGSGSHELRVKRQQGYNHLKASLGLDDPLPKWLSHMFNKLVMAMQASKWERLGCSYNIAVDFS